MFPLFLQLTKYQMQVSTTFKKDTAKIMRRKQLIIFMKTINKILKKIIIVKAMTLMESYFNQIVALYLMVIHIKQHNFQTYKIHLKI
jgi:hypothetical protein